MKLYLITVVIFCLFINIKAQSGIKSENFHKHFTLIKKVKLSEKEPIGNIEALDVDNKGNLLVTDPIGRNVLIFDSKGKLKKKLLPECYPGYKWDPLHAHYKKNGNILVINGIGGFLFGINGDCIKPLSLNFTSTPHICFLNNGDMVGYYKFKNFPHLKMMDSAGVEKFSFGKFPDNYKNLFNRITGGGLISDKDEFIYQLNSTSPVIFKYNSKGKLIRKFNSTPSYYRAISKDISNNATPSVLDEIKKVTTESTLSYSLNLLDDVYLLVQYFLNGSYGLVILDLDGHSMLKENIIIDKPIVLAKKGYIYIVQQLDPINGNLPNPYIEIYKYAE